MTVGSARDPQLTATRIVGVDAARGLAVFGMFVAHLIPEQWPETLADGRSSVLFAVLAGVSLGLITGGPQKPPVDARNRLRLSVLLRALFLIALGLLLWTLDSGIAIILDYYGAFYLVLLPVLFLPRSGLVALAGAFAAAATLILPRAPDTAAGLTGSNLALYLPAEWFLTGYYPGLLWLVYLLLGLLAARSDLTRRRTQLALLIGGAAGTILGYGGAALLGADASAHSDTVWELMGAGGLASAIVGGLTLLTAMPTSARIARPLLSPVSAVGAMPLTIYTTQIILIAAFRGAWGDGGSDSERLTLLLGLVVGSLLLATVWGRLLGRGPLERLVGRLSRR